MFERFYESIANIFKIPDLRKRVLFTLALFAACRLGTFIPTPGIDGEALSTYFKQLETHGGGTLFGLMDLFSGGSLRKLTVFALGVMPYISASIILQLLTAVIPALERLSREGDAGRKKMLQYTRYGTVVLSLFQSFFISLWLENPANFRGISIVPEAGWGFRLLTMITLTSGTALIMWFGEQITERGIGNGISLIICIGILSRFPSACAFAWELVQGGVEGGGRHPMILVLMIAMLSGVIAGVVALTLGQRKIPVQYAKRVVGRRMMSGQGTYIPLKVNYAGVIPVIFASSLLLFPATIGSFFPQARFLGVVSQRLMPGRGIYEVLYVLLIIFFCYFWTATQFNPIQWADSMKKNGAFIPGVRPGRNTADFLDSVMTRITLSGAIGLAFIAVLPTLVSNEMNIPFSISQFFGGTGLIIIVGVMLDTVRQIESHLVMRHYDGFTKKGRLKSRY